MHVLLFYNCVLTVVKYTDMLCYVRTNVLLSATKVQFIWRVLKKFPRQVNFLIDKTHLISNSANAVVSYLHYFFENYGLSETDVHLHCDNSTVLARIKTALYCGTVHGQWPPAFTGPYH